jgi:hypothetical protein
VTIGVAGAPPVTTAAGADDLWHRGAVQVTLTATPGAGGAGVSAVVYQVDGGAPATVAGAAAQVTFAAPADHSGDGVHTLTYYAKDAASPDEAAKKATIRVDTTGPVTSGATARGRAGKPVKLRFKVADALSPQAKSIVIKVKNRRGKVIKTLRPGTRATATWSTAKWRPKAAGTYRYTVTAKDLAGNPQTKAGGGKIKVL